MAGAGFRTFVDGDYLTAAQVNTYLMQQAVMVFADASARSTAIAAPSEGMVTYLTGTDALEVYDGSSWVGINDADAIQNSIVDAKGDIIAATADNTPARLAVGTNEHRLVADSGETTGLKYVADTTNYAISAKGDLLVGTAADTLVNLGVGSDGQVLTADSGETSGVKWAAAAGGGDLVLIDSDTFSAVASVSFDNVFSATYENYIIMTVIDASVNGSLFLRFRTSGSDNSTSNYAWQVINGIGTSVTGGRLSAQNKTSFGSGRPTGGYVGLNATVYSPFATQRTTWSYAISDNSNSLTDLQITNLGGAFNGTTSFDGFKLFPNSGTITGTIYVYGVAS